jgi:hypothetical protein
MSDPALLLKEWEVARQLLESGNTRLHSMRKVGFSLISTVVTAASLFLHEQPGVNTGTAAAAIAAVGVALIIVMCLAERQIMLLQSAASDRATVIERHIGLELSDAISYRYEHERWGVFVKLTYCLFVVVTCGVGWSVGASGGGQTIPIVLIGIAGICLVLFYSQMGSPGEWRTYGDWSFMVVTIDERHYLQLMFSKIEYAKKRWPFDQQGETLWEIRARTPATDNRIRQDRMETVTSYHATVADTHANQSCRMWLVDLAGMRGQYDLYVWHGRKKDRTTRLEAMNRRLRV